MLQVDLKRSDINFMNVEKSQSKVYQLGSMVEGRHCEQNVQKLHDKYKISILGAK